MVPLSPNISSSLLLALPPVLLRILLLGIMVLVLLVFLLLVCPFIRSICEVLVSTPAQVILSVGRCNVRTPFVLFLGDLELSLPLCPILLLSRMVP